MFLYICHYSSRQYCNIALCRRGMARHPNFPRFLTSPTCSRLRSVLINTNQNMEAVFRLLNSCCLLNLTSLEVLTFINSTAGAALLDLLTTTPRLTTLKVSSYLKLEPFADLFWLLALHVRIYTVSFNEEE